MTANVLLGPEFIGKFQNMPHVHRRLLGSANSLSMQHTKATISNCKLLESADLSAKEKRNSVIIEKWPENIDFVCLQEVWDRTSAMALMFKMRKSFTHFLTDVCEDFGNSNNICRCKYIFVFFSKSFLV